MKTAIVHESSHLNMDDDWNVVARFCENKNINHESYVNQKTQGNHRGYKAKNKDRVQKIKRERQMTRRKEDAKCRGMKPLAKSRQSIINNQFHLLPSVADILPPPLAMRLCFTMASAAAAAASLSFCRLRSRR